ncbi:MAG: cell division protein FtsX [Chakrabartia sp.]
MTRLMRLFRSDPAQARVLPEGRLAGPMPWVIAIMIFLTVLAAAAGLALARAHNGLSADLAGRVTIQILEPNPVRQAKQAEAIEARLASLEGVVNFQRVSEAEMARLLEPWFGQIGLGDLPVPLMMDVTLDPRAEDALGGLQVAVKAIAPSARVERHAQWLGPLVQLMQALTWLSGLLVFLIALCVVAVIVLAARSALNMHRPTIEVMHLLGATDRQIARLFQRRLAMDALFGAGVGLVAGLVALFLLHQRFAALGSDLLQSAYLDAQSWALLALIPFVAALLALLAARATLVLALRRLL